MPVGEINNSLITGPGASYSYGGWRGNKAWKKTVTQFIQDKNRNWIQNQAYYKPLLMGALDNRAFGLGGGRWGKGRVTWSTGVAGQGALDKTDLKKRVESNYGFQTVKKRQDDLFAEGETQRNAERNNAQSEFDASIRQLAEQRVNARQQLMNRAGRLGLGFSQGRVNAIKGINTQYDRQSLATKNNFDAAINELVQRGKAAKDDYTYTTDDAWDRATGDEINKMRQSAMDLRRPNFETAKLNSRYQYLDPKTGQAFRFTTKRDVSSKEKIYKSVKTPGRSRYTWWGWDPKKKARGMISEERDTGDAPTRPGFSWRRLELERLGRSTVLSDPSTRDVFTGRYKTNYAPSVRWNQPWRGGARGYRRNA